MNNRFEPLAIGEVLSIDESAQILIGHRTFRVGEFAEAIRTQLEYNLNGWTEDKDAWFSEEGIPCEVLRFSANGWQKGKVRINLEFCPQDFDDKPKNSSASSEDDLVLSAPADSEDELDFVQSKSSSVSFEDELALTALADSEDELDLVESPSSYSDELEQGTPGASNDELELEDPSAIYVEMEQEVIIIPNDQFDRVETATSLDDDFDLGEISQSIEQELELVEAPMAIDEELLDLGEMSASGEDEFEFGEMSASGEDEFEFDDISSNDELEDNETDSLLDDVWQDMNEASWQNNQY